MTLLWPVMSGISLPLDILLNNQTIRLFAGFILLLSALIGFIYRYSYKTAAFISCITAVILIGDAFSFLPKQGRSAIPPDECITIFSHNVLARGYPVNDEIEKIIDEHSPELVFFQEIDSGRWEEIYPVMKERGYSAYPMIEEAVRAAVGSAVFSKLPVRGAQKYIIPGPKWLPDWPAQYCQVKIGNTWVQCVNLHLVPPHAPRQGMTPEGIHWKIAFEQLRSILSMVRNDDLPAILIGDFNMTPNRQLKNLMKGNFTGAWEEAGRGFGFSWHTGSPMFHIDDLYHSNEITVHKAELIRAKYSDHLGVVYKIRVN